MSRALRAARTASWALVGVLVLAVIGEGIGFARVILPKGEAGAGRGTLSAGQRVEPSTPLVESFAAAWQRLDAPPAGGLDPNASVDSLPAAPTDPYPEMRLIGTFSEKGHSFAIIQLRAGEVKLLREGESSQDLHVTAIGDGRATVEVGSQSKELSLPPKPDGLSSIAH